MVFHIVVFFSCGVFKIRVCFVLATHFNLDAKLSPDMHGLGLDFGKFTAGKVGACASLLQAYLKGLVTDSGACF